MSREDERQPLLSGGNRGVLDHGRGDYSQQIQDKDFSIKVYKRRWYVMLVFGIFAMTQCAVWNTFSPVSEIGERVFDWDNATLSLLTNWGPIAYLIATFVFSWILDEKGLKPACVISSGLVAIGTGLRCITTKPSIATPLIHFGQFLNGLAGPIAMGAAPAVSAEWFPPSQRTTATAIATMTNTLGLAVSFIVGPLLVPIRSYNEMATINMNTSFNIGVYSRNSNISDMYNITNMTLIEYDVDRERSDLMKYMYYSFGWSVFSFLLFFTYFPSKPPLPPSPSASMERLNFKEGAKRLIRNRTFWLVCFTYGVSMGVQGCWTGVLDINLKDHGISQNEAAWLGFYGVIAGVVSSLIVARGADIFSKHMKFFLIVLYTLAGAGYLVFALSLIKVIPDTSSVIYSSYIGASFIIGAATPLFFELACEVTYPVAEGITNLVLTLVNNIAGLLFLLVPLIPNLGTMWENWCLVAAIFVCVPVIFTLRERYNRLEIDEEIMPDEPEK